MTDHIIITSPSLDPSKNVSGVSSVTHFIIENNSEHNYIHFEIGRIDGGRKGVYRVISNLRLLFKWILLLRKHPGVTIHYNFPLEKPSILRDPIFMRVARRMGHKLVVHIHGGVFLTESKIPFPFKQRLQSVLRWNVPFITLSDIESSILQKRFNVKNTITLPNCIDLQDAAGFVRDYSEMKEPLVLGYLGRIAETKGMDYLLSACQELKSQGVSFKLRIAGAEEVPGRYLTEFGKLGDSFEYCGLVSGERKNDFLRSLDVFVLPTFFEGLPMSLLECMSYGAVPIVTPVGSIPDVIDDKVNGLFLEIKDSGSIVEAVKTIKDSPMLYKRLSAKARETIFERFDISHYIDTLNGIYKGLNN